MKDLVTSDVQEVDDLRPAEDDDYEYADPTPDWWGPEQERAVRSRILCVCGHVENEHCVPKDDESRECVPRMRTRVFDMEVNEEISGCACMEFQAAPTGITR